MIIMIDRWLNSFKVIVVIIFPFGTICALKYTGDMNQLLPFFHIFILFQGFSAHYFPYENQDGYVSPAVFVQLKNPKSKCSHHLSF